ncbi:MAG: DUF2250 domain-containing protein [Thermodesulfobacteria bacterium]|nr:DUF2250 domain-containing protein [Thermodesulfobacteriota bacterium]
MKTLPWKELSKEDKILLKDLYLNGADCAKFISRRFNWELGATMERLKRLEKLGFLKRVSGRFAVIRGKFKHMNHTYYELTRPAKLYLRKHPEELEGLSVKD